MTALQWTALGLWSLFCASAGVIALAVAQAGERAEERRYIRDLEDANAELVDLNEQIARSLGVDR